MTDDNDHPILTVVGVVAVALGLLMAFVPGFAAAVGTGYAAVTAVGLLALVQGLRVARARQAAEVEAAETPDVETVESVPTPGEEFDRTVAELRSGPRRMLVRERSDLRDTLREAAVTAVADRDNCSPERARERIAAGTWTDDPHAAAFLGGDDAPSPPLLDRLRLAASTESRNQHRIRRTADAVARAAGVAPDDEASSDGPDDDGTGSRGSRTEGWLSRLRSWRTDTGGPGDAPSPDADAASAGTESADRGGSTPDAERATEADRGGAEPADADRRTEAEA
ncbi:MULTISPECIES: hypothetical protein [Halorussus]|uniref:DUF7269 family protein n=1 Tax=Halorussus TaxID=1070314 RepID=UPI000E214D35|nr:MULTISPECIES: hypothetical protein [Halorussus]NHN57691.1 hypothetical protein [Halorussus sp. JP-T4]